ncbi:spermidine synthase [Winogradskyella ouciana]|uniref:Methyltransferase domain-containing protein n=1 Tax=Winogradskyella ouciana TaxID=2608631 RepID=A0A7K1GA21_9FLAO|nr:fused MFS/spermidine synthase [Winogradskyella ouciana]MTE26150.1 methyltransferase domain-containing protein [Winogradskyella ouciana]
MKQVLSYILPVTKTIESDYSGTLEITWHNGKKHLNSQNANYSYGSLQHILKFGIEKINLQNVNSILVLGMGGGSVIATLRKDFEFNKDITAVEIDPVIIDIASKEFGISENENLKILCADALEFVKQGKAQFDLIIVDLFIDLSVPSQFLSEEFWDHTLNLKSSKGDIIFNASVKDTNNKSVNQLINYLKTKVYKVDVFENVNDTNTLVILKSL